MPRGLISRIAAGGGPRRGIGGVASGSARGLLGEAADLLRLDPAAPRAARPKSSSNTGGTRLHHHKAYTVRVDKPNAVFRRMLQQAIGGPEGEMRVMNQYLFQAWGARGHTTRGAGDRGGDESRWDAGGEDRRRADHQSAGGGAHGRSRAAAFPVGRGWRRCRRER